MFHTGVKCDTWQIKQLKHLRCIFHVLTRFLDVNVDICVFVVSQRDVTRQLNMSQV